MEMKQIRKKKLNELTKMREELQVRYADEYFEMRMGKLKDTGKPKKTRRELARVEVAIMEKAMPKAGPPLADKDKLKKEKKDGKAKT